jgi:serine/threonine-protein kinase Chk2
MTAAEDSIELHKEETATPPGGRPSQVTHREPEERYSQSNAYSSPPLQETQAVSTQQIEAALALSDEVEDEVKEGVWGYLFPLDTRYGGRCIVLKKRGGCASPSEQKKTLSAKGKSPSSKPDGKCPSSRGYLIGRHPECGTASDTPSITTHGTRY